jgi:polar amino acid transport system substrate-binding protein
MYMLLRRILPLFFFFSGSALCEAKPVSIAFTFSMPPYLNSDMKSGIERDIIVEALSAGQIELGEIHNVHYKRAMKMLEQGLIDGIVSNMGNRAYDNLARESYPSDKTIDYVDCAITSAKQGIKLGSVNDYVDKSIWAFKTAKTTLGPEFELMANKNALYTEDTDQTKQAGMLALGRIDVAISDRNIFASKVKRDGKYQIQDFEFQTIGSPTPRTLRLSSKTLLENFNKGLAKIKEAGSYAKILGRYKGLYVSSFH